MLEAATPGTYDSVSRAFKQWNNIVRDHLRTETGLRLSVGDDAQSVPVRITDGVPKPLAEVLQTMQEEIAWLILHRPEVEAAVRGTRFMAENARAGRSELPGPARPGTIEEVRQTAEAWLRLIDDEGAIRRLATIEEDVLGAYFFRVPEVRLHWVPIGIVARMLDVSVEALTMVVLAHELAHAYTHLGRDIDGERWDTEAFAHADLEIVEGLAQFYTQVICARLETRVPAAHTAYAKLLRWQSPPYHAHTEWVQDDERGGEIVRVSMIECRTRRIREVTAFTDAVARYRERVRGRGRGASSS